MSESAHAAEDRPASVIATPKRPRNEAPEAADVFSYYAGYSYNWVRASLQRHATAGGLVLDPWNGSGTSTLAAGTLGLRAIGVELSPVPNVIANVRTLTTAQIEDLGRCPRSDRRPDPTDSLLNWLAPIAAGRVRDWTIHADAQQAPTRSVMYVAVFRAVKNLTASFEGSNPTWIRTARSELELCRPSLGEIDDCVSRNYEEIVDALRIEPLRRQPAIIRASSTKVPLRSGSVAHIIGSPPYLTRLDYAVAYSRELAVLGIDVKGSTIRADLMGTTRIRKNARLDDRFPRSLLDAINSIRSHSSKESSGYYLKQAIQYFTDLRDSLRELSRVARPKATLEIVVQDSYYKDVHIPLVRLCQDLLETDHWETKSIQSVAAPRLLTTLNTAAWQYSKGHIAESILSMEKI